MGNPRGGRESGFGLEGEKNRKFGDGKGYFSILALNICIMNAM